MKAVELCSRHKPPNAANDKDFRLQYVCLHRNCQERFRLCCMKCRNEQHRDHAIKLLTLTELLKELDRLKNEVTRRQPLTPEYYELENKMGLIRQFRVNLYLQEAALVQISEKLLGISSEIEKQRSQLVPQIEKHLQEIRQSPAVDATNKVLQRLCECLEYSQARMKIELANDRHKTLEQSRNKLQQEAQTHTGRMKEYLMKIIEVLLDKGDDQQKGSKKELSSANNETNSAEELRKVLQQELASLDRDMSLKMNLKASIEERLEGLGVDRSANKQESKTPSRNSSNRNSVQTVKINDLPLVRCQSRQREESEEKRQLSSARNKIRQFDKSDVAEESELIKQKNKEIESLRLTIERSEEALERYCQQIEHIRAGFVKEIEKLQNELETESSQKQRLAQEVLKCKQLLEGKEQMEQNLKEISEHYNELIYEYNAIKDQRLNSPNDTQIHQLRLVNESLQAQVTQLQEDLRNLKESTANTQSERDRLKKQVNNLQAINGALEKDNKLVKDRATKEKAEFTKRSDAEITEIKRLLEEQKSLRSQHEESSLSAQQAKKKLELELKQIKGECDKIKGESKQQKQEVERMRGDSKRKKEDEEKSKEDIKTLKQQLERRKAEAEKFRSEVKRAKSEAESVCKQNTELKQAVVVFKAEKESFLRERAIAEAERSELVKSHAAQQNTVQALAQKYRIDCETMNRQLSRISDQLKVRDGISNSKTLQLEQAVKELERVRNERATLQTTLSSQAELKNLSEASFERELEKNRQELFEQSQQLMIIKHELEHTVRTKQELLRNVASLSEENRLLLETKLANHSQIENLNRELEASTQEIILLKQQVDELRNLQRRAEQSQLASQEHINFNSEELKRAQYELSVQKVEYDKLKAQLKCEMDKASALKQRLEGELERSKQTCTSVASELEQSKLSNEKLRDDIKVVSRSCEELRFKISELETSKIQWMAREQRLAEAEAKNGELQNQRQRLINQEQALLGEIDRLKSTNESISQKLASEGEHSKANQVNLHIMASEMERLKRTNETNLKLVEQARAAEGILKSTLQQVEKTFELTKLSEAQVLLELDATKQELSRTSTQLTNLQHHSNELNESLINLEVTWRTECQKSMHLEDTCRGLDNECIRLKTTVAELERIISLHKNDLSVTYEQYRKLERVAADREQQCIKLKAQLTDTIDTKRHSEVQISKLEAQLAGNIERVRELERLNEKHQAEVASARNALSMKDHQSRELAKQLEEHVRIRNLENDKNTFERNETKSKYQQQQTHIVNSLAAKNQELLLVNEQKLTAENARNDLQAANLKLNEELKRAKAESEGRQRCVDAKQQELNFLSDRIMDLNKRNSELSISIQEAQKKEKTLNNTLSQLERTNASLKSQVDSLKLAVESKGKDAVTQINQLGQRLQKAEQQVRGLSQQLSSLRVEHSHLSTTNISFCKKLEEAEEKRNQLEDDCLKRSVEATRLQNQISEIRSLYSKQTEQLHVLQSTHNFLEEQLRCRNKQFGMMDMELQQLRSENDRMLKSRLAQESNKRLLTSNDTLLLTRELNNCKDQLSEERKRNCELKKEHEQLYAQLMEYQKKVPKKSMSKDSQAYRALHQVVSILKEDMQILESRMKDKDLIEKIYLKELESKKAEVARLTNENQKLRLTTDQNNPIPYLVSQSQPPSMLSKLEDAAIKLKNKENKLQDRLVNDRICNFFESINKQ